MSLDFQKLSLEELKELLSDVKAAINKKIRAEKKHALDAIKKLAHEFELTDEDVLSAISKKRTVDPKYRNPDNPDEVWSGRGLKPNWLKSKLESGSSLESFKI